MSAAAGMPLADRPALLFAALAYCLVVLAIGVWAKRRTRSARDFFIAGQRIGLLVTAFATMSAAFSGFVFLGGPGLMYRLGLGSLFINVPVSFTAGLLCWTLAKRLRLLAAVREVFTIPDALAARYGSRSVAGLGAVAVLVGTVGYLGVQIQALGILVESLFGTRELLGAWSAPAAMAAGLAVVLLYTVAGGMLAGVYTDLFQGALMMAAAVAVFERAMAAGGGLGAIGRAIAGSEAFGPSFLDPLGSLPAATAVGFFFVFGVGVLGQPHMLHKFYMLDDPQKLKWMPAVLAGSQSVCLLIWFGIGVAVPGLVAQGRLAPLLRPDDAAPAFLLGFAPPALAGLVVAGILAAIMSTANSFLNIGAAVLVRDLPRSLTRRAGSFPGAASPPGGDAGGRGASDLARARAATLAIGIAAALSAWAWGDLIALLGTFAFGTFAAALAPALAVGFNWTRVTPAAAAASIAVGLLANLGLELAARGTWGLPRPPLPPGALPSAVALAASFTTLFLVTALTRPRAVEADVAAVMDV